MRRRICVAAIQNYVEVLTLNKLFIFGDSILKGVTFSAENGKYKLCPQDYSKLVGEGISVNNLSKMGATIEYGERVLKEELKNDGKDCVVLLEYGGNDCDYPWRDISANPDNDYHCKTLPSVFEEKYRACIEYAQSVGAKVMMANLPPLDSEKYMKWICRGLNYDVILRWLGDKSMLYRWHENYNRLIERIADSLGLTLIDLRSAFLTSHSFNALISNDGIHPTEDGHRLINNLVTGTVLAAV